MTFDSRFTFGLVGDVAELLHRRGFVVESGHDRRELREHLRHFLYGIGDCPAGPCRHADAHLRRAETGGADDG